ncbi:mechanosensitive ion channel family protein [Streptomyces sp. NBC_01537]|uniref:mechanosensitive ion channel family protein n=1 Tax=Streptomyces sp. NBC_01537 TaxID=2903896 RepID=UPI0038649434
MENVIRPLIVAGGAVVITLAAGWAVDQTVRRIGRRHPESPLWGLLRRCRVPFQLALCAALLRGAYGYAHIARDHRAAVGQALVLFLIAACAWLAVRVAAAVVESSYARFASATPDAARVRRVRTQVTLIQRVVSVTVGVVAVAAMLLTFPAMRTVGASLLASAGVIGIVAGVAAQSTLANVFAGLQIAFGDIVRIGDVGVFEGEWGTVEEITLTYLVVRTWDERRITMPVSYFTSKPFENWSRNNPRMTGTVFFHLDHATPIDLMREHLHDVLKDCAEWDGRAWGLVITDTTPSTIQVRALATAKDADDIWNLRCIIREQLIAWLRHEHPYALPRINTAPAPGLAEAPDREAAVPRSNDMGPGPGNR